MKELRKLGCPKDLYKLINSYLSHREIIRQEGANKLRKKTTMGCPQGSVLGPIFWILIFNAVLRDTGKEKCKKC